jgi:hypothetical protein
MLINNIFTIKFFFNLRAKTKKCVTCKHKEIKNVWGLNIVVWGRSSGIPVGLYTVAFVHCNEPPLGGLPLVELYYNTDLKKLLTYFS